MNKKEITIGVLTGVIILLVFNIAISQSLSVKQIETAPKLKVIQGSSLIYEDGTIELQPAKAAVQQTIRSKELQGN